MATIRLFKLLLVGYFALSTRLVAQNVGIGTGSPDPSALLELNSTSHGLLLPRMTEAQRNAISSPATGLIIYQTDMSPGIYMFDGTIWRELATGPLTGWSTTGNAMTNPLVNFIGTTDAQPLKFRVNNLPAGELSNNTGFGIEVLSNISSGTENSAFGAYSLYNNTSGNYNVAIGDSALFMNRTANYNTAVGYVALTKNITGFSNTAIGAGAMYQNTSGIANTAIGRSSLHENTTGRFNTAIGTLSLAENTTGLNNTAIGSWSLYRNTTGSNNTAIGYLAG
ncbi:MAG: hypothetical protein NZ108_11100, partial [Bacteroidia bacterium]|nr:hypothetical protein [Bacteroidia bacterium]